MLKFYYDTKYKYTNRTIIDLTGDSNYREVSYLNIDTPDTINGHIIYTFGKNETALPTYIYDTENSQRWFVSGITPLSARKKYQISLLRDIISENPVLWANEQCAYISAGLAPITNYNKYKRWGLPFTNTKVGQQKLTISGGSSFFVFYTNEQHVSSDVISESDLVIQYSGIPGVSGIDYTVNSLNEIPSYEYVGLTSKFVTDFSFKFKTIMYKTEPNPPALTQLTGVSFNYTDMIFNTPNIYLSTDDAAVVSDYMYIACPYNRVSNNENSSKSDLRTVMSNTLNTYLASNVLNQITQTAINNLNPYVGKTIKDSSTNKVYRLNLTYGSTSNLTNQQLSSAELSTFNSAIYNISWPNLESSNPNNFTTNGTYTSIDYETQTYTYSLEEIGVATDLDITLKAGIRKLPKSAVRCVNIVPNTTIGKEDLAQALMLAQINGTNGLNENTTVGRILDIQYLPFSIATTANANIKINNTSMTAEFLDSDDFQYDINLIDLTNINKETDSIKIVSPSRASQYLFKPYDNDGNMEFSAKITLKPYASTIYVRPSTKGLLMQDWDDKDCLIIQEDMSLTNVTSQWTEYVYNNRNFLNSFERQIQGREFERGWERRVEEAQKAAEDWTGRNIKAQKSAAYSGNLPIVSSIVGSISLATGPDTDYMYAAQLDRQYNEAMYQEGLSLSRDLFNYQLDNIKSQPLIPSKVTTIDCKFLDGIYLEFYSTNPTELNAIAKYYEYNGNRIDDYGTFAEYWGNFVRGKLIKAENYTQPEFEEINRRLEMGIFTGGITV